MRTHLKQHYQYALESIRKTCQVIRSVYRKSHIGFIWKGIGFILQVIVIIILTVIILFKFAVSIIAIPLTLFLWIIRFLLGAI